MGPVYDGHGAVVSYDHIAGIEVPVAELGVVRHGIQSCMKLISGGGIYGVFQTGNLPGKFILLKSQAGSLFLMHGKLQIHKLLHVFLRIGRIFLHKLFQSFSLYIFNGKSPFSVNHADFQDSGDIQTAFFHAGLAESLVKYIRFPMLFGEHLDNAVAVFVDHLVGTGQKYCFIF